MKETVEKLRFVLMSGEEKILDEVLEYKKEKEYYLFQWNKMDFKVRLSEHFHFIRETDEDRFELRSFNNINKCLYLLKKENLCFGIEVIEFEYKIEDNSYTIKYALESTVEDDSFSVKKIILSFD